jgi:hypothetical protein
MGDGGIEPQEELRPRQKARHQVQRELAGQGHRHDAAAGGRLLEKRHLRGCRRGSPDRHHSVFLGDGVAHRGEMHADSKVVAAPLGYASLKTTEVSCFRALGDDKLGKSLSFLINGFRRNFKQFMVGASASGAKDNLELAGLSEPIMSK